MSAVFQPESLCPPPQQCRRLGGALKLRLPLRVHMSVQSTGSVPDVYALLQRARRGGWIGAVDAFTSETADDISLRIELSREERPQGFELLFAEPQLLLRAADLSGVRHGLALLSQIFSGCARDEHGQVTLPALHIRDWPDFAARGVMLDISRTRVPTRAWLMELLDTLEGLRINQLQLYTEHTFAYPGHERVWADASPLTSDDILALDAAAHERGIELIPNQQSFGHMHRWLIHEPYRALAEVPEGVEHAFSRSREPFALCPLDPGTLPFVTGLMDQLLPHFRSRQFNVGGDETFDLGLGRSRSACEERGKGRVYLDFLQQLEREVRRRGRRMQFWGDIILQHPELIGELPRDAIAMEWGYDADHPFAQNLARFAASGLEFQVCPGTSSWQSFGGRTENMLSNIAAAAEAGHAAGAQGLLVTDWGDRGHLQPHLTLYPGLLSAAALSWNARARDRVRASLSHWLDQWIFADPRGRLGECLLELGRAHEWSGARSTNGTALFFLIAFAKAEFPHPRTQNLSLDGLHACLERLSGVRTRIETARAARETDQDAARWIGGMLAFSCRLGIARLRAGAGVALEGLPRSQARLLAGELEHLIDEHQRLWHVHDRPGGWSESSSWLREPQRALQWAQQRAQQQAQR